MNLSLTELIIASSGNTVLAFNSFQKRWTLSSAACQVNAFGMTYLGEQYFGVVLSHFLILSRYSVHRDPVLAGPSEVHDGHQGQAVPPLDHQVHPPHTHLHLDILILSSIPSNTGFWNFQPEHPGCQVMGGGTQLMIG